MAGRQQDAPRDSAAVKAERQPSVSDLLDRARLSLATELVRATDVDDGGMDVAYAERLAGTLSTLKEV